MKKGGGKMHPPFVGRVQLIADVGANLATIFASPAQVW